MSVFFHRAAPSSKRRPPWQEERTLHLLGQTVKTKIRVNRRARRVILRVDPIGQTLNITSPSKRAIPEAITFAQSSATWICKELNNGAVAKPFQDGSTFPFLGREIVISNEMAARRRTTLDGDRLIVGGTSDHLNRRVVEWLKKEARSNIVQLSDQYTDALQKKYRKISIRDTKSRWGSCSSDGTLSFSWRIVLAPRPVFDYVVAHECAHLVHLNHSKPFWNVVASLGVDAQAASIWFDRNGAALHAWGVPVSSN